MTQSAEIPHKQIASQCNNKAWDLIEQVDLTTDQKLELVTLAATALHHWSQVGSSSQIAHAELLFGWALARAGAGELALAATQKAVDYFETHEGEIWERAFASAALAAAYQAAGDQAQFVKLRKNSETLGEQLRGADATYFLRAFKPLQD